MEDSFDQSEYRIEVLGPGDRVIRRKSSYAIGRIREENILFNREFGGYCKLSDFGASLLSGISGTALRVFFSMVSNLEYRTNKVVCAGNTVTPAILMGILELSKSSAYRAIEEIVNMNVVAKSAGAFYVNPWIVCRGATPSDELLEMFAPNNK